MVAALIVRVVFALILDDRSYQADESGWHNQAVFWSETFSFGSEGKRLVVAPFPSVVFGTAYLIFGPVRWAARLIQAFVGVAAVWALGKTTETATGSARAGLIATAIGAIYPFFIYYSGLLMSETLYICLVVCALGLTIRSIAERGASVFTAITAGVFWAAAGLCRTEGVPIAFVLWIALLGLSALRRYSAKSAVLALLFWALPLGGWAVRNHGLVGHYTLDTHGGITLLDGSMNFDLNEQDTIYARQAFRNTEIYRQGQSLSEFDQDAFYRKAALGWMRDHPGETLRQWVHKAFNFWRLYPRLNKEVPSTADTNATIGMKSWFLAAVSLCSEPALIVFGFLGAWGLRGRIAELFPLYWMILATFGVHVIVISQMRYRLPVMPVLILFAAYRLDQWLPQENSG